MPHRRARALTCAPRQQQQAGERRGQRERQHQVEVAGRVAQVEAGPLGAVERAVAAPRHVIPQEVQQRHLCVLRVLAFTV